MKTSLIELAKSREREIKKLRSNRIIVLKGYYSSILQDIQKGMDCFDELNEIKKKLNNVYKERAKEKIDKMRGLQIDDHTYDIHKLQNQRKYEGQTRINEIEIDGVMYSGLSNVLQQYQRELQQK